MTPEINIKTVMELTNAGFMFGPFFFAVFFMLVITGSAHYWYSKVVQRTAPPASDAEKTIYRNYFWLSFSCGILLVFVSVGWWLYTNWKEHSFQGVVIGLEMSQNLVAGEEDYYTREVNRKQGAGGEVKDYHFAIVRPKPFTTGQTFTLKFYPEIGGLGDHAPQAIEFAVPYAGLSSARFKIGRDSANKFQLVSIGGVSKGG